MGEATVDSPRLKCLGIDDICRVTGIARATIYMMIQRKEFPKPSFKLGRRSIWREATLIAWMDKREKRGAAQ